MTERTHLQPIHGSRTQITVRDYSVPHRGIVVEREGARTSDTHETPFYAGVSKEGAIALRDFLLERYPLTDAEGDDFPRTVQDLDGDVWIEVEPDSFKMRGICATRSLDEIERNYGIDDRQTFEPRTIQDRDGDVWVEVAPEEFLMADYLDSGERRSLDYVDETYGIDAGEEPVPAPTFEVGQRVRITGDTGSAHDLRPYTRARIVEVLGGSTFLIEDDGTNLEDYRFDGVGLRYVAADEIQALPHAEQYGDEGYLKRKPQDAGDPTGSIVFVTGDSGEWGHGFEPGTAVEIEEDDYLLDGSYGVRSVKGGRDEYVGANDLAIESPRQQTIPTGARVKVLNDGTDEGLRHYLEVGSFGTVTGWTDTSTEKGSPYAETYTVDGAADDSSPCGVGTLIAQSLAPGSIVEEPAFSVGDYVRHTTGNEGRIVRIHEFGADVEWLAGPSLVGVTCQAALVNLTKVDEPEPVFPGRFILGADPSVVEWGEVMRRSLAATRDALVTLPEADFRIGRLVTEPAPKFEVGTRVRLIDDGGDNPSPAKVGDLGTVEKVVAPHYSQNTLLRVRMDDGHLTGRFARRWEVAGADTDPNYCTVCRKAPCPLGGEPVRY